MSKPKILWVSDLVTKTGFSRVSHSILNGLTNDYDIVGLGVNYRGDPHPYPYPIYPAGASGRVFGEDRLVTILNNAKFDILYILNDAWVISVYLDAIKKGVTAPLPKIVVYFPVDSMSHDKEWYQNFNLVSKAVTYTQFGVDVVNDSKCAPELKLDIIPHGVDSNIFYKKFTNRRDAKQSLIASGKSPDSFVFLSANRNQPRKKLDITMEGFKLFSEGKNDVLLHMHCGVRDAHIDVPKLAIRLGIDSKVILTNLNTGVQQVPESVLNDIYNASDVGLNTSLGEGWGLTSVEHAITGAPQIVPDHSACREIFSDCGVIVPTSSNITFDNSMTVGRMITPELLAGKMNQIYTDKALYEELSNKSIAKFSHSMYSWSEISNSWNALFKEVLS
jgi:glycosyltransferase involved in cell wall biosynthesis